MIRSDSYLVFTIVLAIGSVSIQLLAADGSFGRSPMGLLSLFVLISVAVVVYGFVLVTSRGLATTERPMMIIALAIAAGLLAFTLWMFGHAAAAG